MSNFPISKLIALIVLVSHTYASDLFSHVENGNVDSVQMAIENGANVNAMDQDGSTILQLSLIPAICGEQCFVLVGDQRKQRIDSLNLLNRHRDEIAYLLLQAGADYLKKDPYGWTPYERVKDNNLYAKFRELLFRKMKPSLEKLENKN